MKDLVVSEDLNIVAMIPARIGSTRLKMKNLALIDGKPLIYYAIEAARTSGVFNKIVLNSDNEIFAEIARRYDVEFYQRPVELGSSTTKSDTVVYDFMLKYPSDVLVWTNPTSPLQTDREVKAVINYFVKEELDTLITTKNEQVHCVYKDKPINFQMEEIFAQTQDLEPVQPFVYSIMMWRNRTFMDAYEKHGHALFCGKVGYYSVSKKSTLIVKTEEDLLLADYIMRAEKQYKEQEVKYDEIVHDIEGEQGK
jgi:CMP-N-acetylneuraminic acid synthetase